MKKIGLFLAFFLLVISVGYSQKLQYGGIQQFGLIFGESRVSSSFNLVNGLRFGRYFTGIGVDAQFNHRYYYSNNYFSSLPYNNSAVYADLRYYINKKKNFFAIANGGVNLINEKLYSLPNEKFKKLSGYYCAFGLGFKAKLGKEVYYSFDVNYAIRQTRFNYDYINFRNEWQTEKYDVRQYSILVRMGLEIF